MPAPDTTILDLLLAGDYAGANDALEQGHPDAALDLIASAALRAANSGQATSGTSVTIATGTITFTLDSPRGWPQGMPVYIMEAADPVNRFMVGKLAVPETSAGVIQVSVVATSGTGTFSSWTILALFSAVNAAAPPLAAAQGGTGATSYGGARTNMEVSRTRKVLGVQTDPPGSPSAGDLYGVLQTGTGAWTGHSGDWAQWTGSAWSFETPVAGDLTFAQDTGRTWKSLGVGVWVLLAREENRPVPLRTLTSTTTLTAADLGAGDVVILLDPTGGSFTVTLPLAGIVPNCLVRLCSISAVNTVTVNVASSGTISGSASKVINAGTTLVVFAYYTASPAVARWVLA